jgi:hypothetical protein
LLQGLLRERLVVQLLLVVMVMVLLLLLLDMAGPRGTGGHLQGTETGCSSKPSRCSSHVDVVCNCLHVGNGGGWEGALLCGLFCCQEHM